MILAAGLGTRLRPLSELRAKPALPVRGIPLVAYALRLLAHHGIGEVLLNLHHRPQSIERAVEQHCPPGLRVVYSREDEPLGTGGGIRAAAHFLRASDPCLVLAGDMLLDFDLGALLATHRARGSAVTFLLCDDRRADRFGTIGLDAGERVVRIARRMDLGGETCRGVYAHATLVAARALDALPERRVFSHLDGWIAPLLESGARDVRGVLAPAGTCLWEPVGTLAEYLEVNLAPHRLSYLDADALARALGVRLEPGLVVGAGARLGAGASLERAVVWDGEQVPDGLRASDGVFAGGRFHALGEDPA
jgi:NDP-sugar pyrophosphorylase family protein